MCKPSNSILMENNLKQKLAFSWLITKKYTFPHPDTNKRLIPDISMELKARVH